MNKKAILNSFSKRNFKQVIEYLDSLDSTQLDDVDLLLCKSISEYSTGQVDRALKSFKEASEKYPKSVHIQFNYAVVLYQIGRFDDAEKQLFELLTTEPLHPQGNNLLGILAAKNKNFNLSCDSFRKAIRSIPNYIEPVFNLATLHCEHRHFSEAEELARRVIQLNPVHSGAYNLLGNIKFESGDIWSAQRYYLAAKEIDPTNVDTIFNEANAYRALGDFESAFSGYEKVLELDPYYSDAYFQLSNLPDCDISKLGAQIVELKKRGYESSTNRDYLLTFALANLFDKKDNVAKAFDLYVEANRDQRALQPYNFESERELFGKLVSAGKHLLPMTIDDRSNSLSPIFIIGMPRSGTSLVEQILGSHADITALGELDSISRYGKHLATAARAVSASELEEFREAYLSHAETMVKGRTKFFTDKMPTNFKYIYLIASAFPTAPVIHITRDLRAVCWSNFRTHFPASGMLFTNSLKDLVAYVKCYQYLMERVATDHPGRIISLNYECLTENLESEVRRLIDECGLHWDDACMTPERSATAVTTASALQVRKPVYRHSSEAWLRYEAFLHPYFTQLDSGG